MDFIPLLFLKVCMPLLVLETHSCTQGDQTPEIGTANVCFPPFRRERPVTISTSRVLQKAKSGFKYRGYRHSKRALVGFYCGHYNKTRAMGRSEVFLWRLHFLLYCFPNTLFSKSLIHVIYVYWQPGNSLQQQPQQLLFHCSHLQSTNIHWPYWECSTCIRVY